MCSTHWTERPPEAKIESSIYSKIISEAKMVRVPQSILPEFINS